MGFKHRSNNDGRFSDAIWADLPEEIKYDPTVGIYRHEDWANFGKTTAIASNVGRYAGKAGPYVSFEDTGCAVLQDVTALGTVKVTTDSDNDEVSISTHGVLGKFNSDTTSPRKMWFETRIAVAQIVTQNFFIGLAEEDLAGVTGVIGDTGVIAAKDYVGFQVAEAASATLTLTYKKAGQTAQVPISSLSTLVADTYVNLGWVFDPQAPVAKRIKIFVNGAEQSTYVTATNTAAATFPSGEEMSFLWAISPAATASNVYRNQGWQFAQLY
jgi:hypothetical protein